MTKQKSDVCEHPHCNETEDLVFYHQRTRYVEEDRNWVTLCPVHRKENDEYWDDMWAEYYSGLL